MKLPLHQLTGFILIACTITASAAVLYVNVNSITPLPPYKNWATAANVIQDAVDAASAGDLILVTNGIYQTGGMAVQGSMTNRVAITKTVVLKSVGGAGAAIIKGHQVDVTTNGDDAVRCAYLANGACIVGFTLTGGATRTNGDWTEQTAGGIWCERLSGVGGDLTNFPLISDCIISNNCGGGVYGGVLSNCTLVGNSGSYGGGATLAFLTHCIISSNSVGTNGTEGGGVASCVLDSCILSSNLAWNGGGSAGGILTNCLLVGNFAGRGGGGAASTGVSGHAVLNNCTIVGNSAGEFGGGLDEPDAVNCIVYDNNAPTGANYYAYWPDMVYLSYSCTTPLPQGGLGNFTNAPQFVSEAGGDLHLQSNSPCINSGQNSVVGTVTDLDGNPRVRGGTLDVGAYEFQNPTSVISYAWLQEYGLPIDGSADFIDTDHDGLNNWKEWFAGTNPTNASSLLALLPPTATVSNTTVCWQSVSNRTYFLQRSTNLTASPAFVTLQSNIVGQAGTTCVIDTLATNVGLYFYRVGVEQ